MSRLHSCFVRKIENEWRNFGELFDDPLNFCLLSLMNLHAVSGSNLLRHAATNFDLIMFRHESLLCLHN